MPKLDKTNQEGYVLVFTLLLLVVLTLLGVSAIDTSIFESNMAANDALYKRAFYQADSGAEMGIRLAYDNAICVQTNKGFDPAGNLGSTSRTIGNLVVYDLDFSSPQDLDSTVVSDSNRAAAYYLNGVLSDIIQSDKTPHTNLLFNGNVKITPGSGLQMVSGYDGLGSSSAAGGTHLVYDIYSQNIGARNSGSLITLGWRLSTHIINNVSSSDCGDHYLGP